MTAVRYVGHSTVLIELDGVRLLTDPLLRRRVLHLHRRSPIDLEPLRSPDAVLISHAHRDHLDLPSLRLLDRKVTAVVPRGLARPVERIGFERVVEVDEGESVSIGSVEVRATHASTTSGAASAVLRGASLGYAIGGTHRIYFAGDTSLFPEMDGLVPDLDLALIPIWGWGPTLGSGEHLDPRAPRRRSACSAHARPSRSTGARTARCTTACAASPTSSPSRRKSSSARWRRPPRRSRCAS